MKKPIFYLILILLALAGMAVLVFSTPKGLGLVNDSVAYINGARGLVEGSGYGRIAGDGTIRPITHFPPGLSVVLSLFGLVGLDAIPAARFANTLLFGLNIVLAGLLAREVSRSLWAGVMAAALVAFSEALLRVHAFALSEPLFLTLTLGSLLTLARVLQAPPHSIPVTAWVITMVVAGDLAGLSYLTRYVGAAILPAAAPALLAVPGLLRDRLRNVGLFWGSALAWVLVWTVRNAALTGSATNRTLGYHAIPTENWLEGVRNFWAFLLPVRIPLLDWLPNELWAALTALLVLVILAGLFVGLRAALRRSTGELGAWLVGLHLAAYLATILLSMTFVDASTLFEDRILAPVYVDFVILLAWLLTRLNKRTRAAYRTVLVVFVVLLALSFADDARKTALELRVDGQGYASSFWTNSQTMDHVRRLPDVTVYTDRLAAVSLLADRQAFALLSPTDPVTREPRPNFEQTQTAIHAALLEGRAVLVVFSIQGTAKEDWFQQLVEGVPEIARYPDGVIYGQAKN